jgi:hypothetical protein
MGLGILSDHALEHVPGTAQVFEGEQRREVERKAGSRIGHSGLKYDKTGKILLVPQPSDDPNDPLVCPLNVPFERSLDKYTRLTDTFTELVTPSPRHYSPSSVPLVSHSKHPLPHPRRQHNFPRHLLRSQPNRHGSINRLPPLGCRRRGLSFRAVSAYLGKTTCVSSRQCGDSGELCVGWRDRKKLCWISMGEGVSRRGVSAIRGAC